MHKKFIAKSGNQCFYFFYHLDLNRCLCKNIFENMNRLAVFILSTVKSNGKFTQFFPNYYESRILPIINTWGLLIPNLIFVFGTNVFDLNFIKHRCKKIIVQQRKLTPYTPQTTPVDSIEEYTCPVEQYEGLNWIYNKDNNASNNTKKKTNIISSFNIIRMSNCTGEYFGRC